MAHFSTSRISVESLLGQAGVSLSPGARDLSHSTLAKTGAALGDLNRGEFLASMVAGKAIGDSLGLAARHGETRVFPNPYATVALAFLVVMSGSPSGLRVAVDTRRGAYLEGALAQDMLSSRGTLAFDLHDLGPAGTEVVGATVIPGQMFAWGKGQRALSDQFARAEAMMRRF
jgi:hypothetical protein